MTRRKLLGQAFGTLAALGALVSSAHADIQWQDKWKPVKDGYDSKLLLRLGKEGNTIYHQWRNDYEQGVKFQGLLTYKLGPTKTSQQLEQVSLDAGEESKPLPCYDLPLIDVAAQIPNE